MKRIISMAALIALMVSETAVAAPVAVDFSVLGSNTIGITTASNPTGCPLNGVTFRYDDLGSGVDTAQVDQSGIFGTTSGSLILDFGSPVTGMGFDFSLLGASQSDPDALYVLYKRNGTDVGSALVAANQTPYVVGVSVLGDALGTLSYGGPAFDEAFMFFSVDSPYFSVWNVTYLESLRPALGYLFPVIARDKNQSSVAGALDSIYDSASAGMQTVLARIVSLDDVAAITQTFEETSPARLNLLTRQTVLGINEVADKVNERIGFLASSGDLGKAGRKDGTIWAGIDSSRTNGKSSAGGFGSDADSNLVTLGWEKQNARSLLGIALSYDNNSLNWAGSTGTADSNSTLLTGYYGRTAGEWAVGAELGVGVINTDADRRIPSLDMQLEGSHAGTGLMAGISAYRQVQRRGWTLTPSAGLLYTRVTEDAYKESGGSLAMNIDSRAVDAVRGDIGVSADKIFNIKGHHPVTHSMRLRLLCPLTDRDANISATFVSDPSSRIIGSDSASPGNMIQASYAISKQLGSDRTLSLGYDYRHEFGGGITDNSVSLQYSVGF